jgi:hypothetical protein
MSGSDHITDTVPPSVIHYYVDEAGDPTLFNAGGKIIVGDNGCSRYFILGKLDVDDPPALTAAMESLRAGLLADPYFKNIPSMLPAERKTAAMFHAKDDIPEVGREVFKLLTGMPLKFYAVVRDKRELANYVLQHNEEDPKYKYTENTLYDSLVQKLFRSRFFKAEQFNICFSKRGKSDRTAALKKAISDAVAEFEASFGIKSQAKVEITAAAPPGSGGLQAVDYFLWALQRFYNNEGTEKEESESRYIEMLMPQVGEIEDLDFELNGKRGVFWNKSRPLTLAARRPPEPKTGAKKKPGI